MEIQSNFYQTPGRGNKLKSKQHDEWAVLNYYNKVSKYDLDRSNLKMRQNQSVKQMRRFENAAAKRKMINGQIRQERF